MVEYLLTLPAANPTPYRFVELDWNPEGHMPKGIYTAKVTAPQKAVVAGPYASEYRVFWNADTKEYRVALTGLTEIK